MRIDREAVARAIAHARKVAFHRYLDRLVVCRLQCQRNGGGATGHLPKDVRRHGHFDGTRCVPAARHDLGGIAIARRNNVDQSIGARPDRGDLLRLEHLDPVIGKPAAGIERLGTGSALRQCRIGRSGEVLGLDSRGRIGHGRVALRIREEQAGRIDPPRAYAEGGDKDRKHQEARHEAAPTSRCLQRPLRAHVGHGTLVIRMGVARHSG